jgi:hypothetical protein
MVSSDELRERILVAHGGGCRQRAALDLHRDHHAREIRARAGLIPEGDNDGR